MGIILRRLLTTLEIKTIMYEHSKVTENLGNNIAIMSCCWTVWVLLLWTHWISKSDDLFWITVSHWDFLCSDRSNVNLMRWWILVIVSFVGINNDKITIWWTKIIKLTWEIILMKMKISARWRHCSKIFKTNLKTHISPLLNHPQGCQGCQKNQKDLRFLT